MKVTVLKVRSRNRFKPFAWAIRKNQKTKWNHYAIEYYNEDGEVQITDAKRKGIRKANYNEFIKNYRVIERVEIELPCTPEQFDEWVDKKIGTKYAFWQLIGIGLIAWGIIKNNPFGKNRKYLVCHEYCLVMVARWLKIEIGDSDNYTFKKVDAVLDTVKVDA